MANSFQITNYELWLLLTTISPISIVGFQNPTVGMLMKDIRVAASQASKSLQAKKLITIGPEGDIIPSQELTGFLDLLHNADDSFLISTRIVSESVERVFSFHTKSNQVLFLIELENHDYCLQRVWPKSLCVTMTLVPFSPQSYSKTVEGRLIIGADELLEIQQAVKEGNHDIALSKLLKAHGEEKVKTRFFESLTATEINLSFIAFKERSNPRKASVDGFALIADKQVMWIMEVVDEDQNIVAIKSISRDDLIEILYHQFGVYPD